VRLLRRALGGRQAAAVSAEPRGRQPAAAVSPKPPTRWTDAPSFSPRAARGGGGGLDSLYELLRECNLAGGEEGAARLRRALRWCDEQGLDGVDEIKKVRADAPSSVCCPVARVCARSRASLGR